METGIWKPLIEEVGSFRRSPPLTEVGTEGREERECLNLFRVLLKFNNSHFCLTPLLSFLSLLFF